VKINEIINEGIWDKVKSAAGKAATGAKKFGADVASSVADAPGAGYAKGWGRVGNRLAKQAVGKDPSGAWLDKDTTPAITPPQATPATPAITPPQATPATPAITPPKGTVALIDVGHGPDTQAYFKSYSGKWYSKYTQGTEFATTHPVTRPEDIESLEKIAKDSKPFIIPVVPNPKGPSNSFITDPKHIRAVKLAQNRSRRGKL
jgi:hypothetical protein